MVTAAALSAGFAVGDPDAIRTVYRSYGALVCSVSYMVLGDAGLAEAATQQVFLQAWTAAPSSKSDRPLGPWLCSIAQRVAIDVYRRERCRRGRAALDTSDPALATDPPSADQIADRWEVRQALDLLPLDDRELIRWQHYRGLDHTEIAQLLDVPVGTVKSRSHRAHRRLAQLLGLLRADPAEQPAAEN